MLPAFTDVLHVANLTQDAQVTLLLQMCPNWPFFIQEAQATLVSELVSNLVNST